MAIRTDIILAKYLRPRDMMKVCTETPKFAEVLSTMEDPDRHAYPMIQIEVIRHTHTMFITVPPTFPIEILSPPKVLDDGI